MEIEIIWWLFGSTPFLPSPVVLHFLRYSVSAVDSGLMATFQSEENSDPSSAHLSSSCLCAFEVGNALDFRLSSCLLSAQKGSKFYSS